MNDPFPLVVANLKANKSWAEMVTWLTAVGPSCTNFPGSVVICPTTVFLAVLHQKIESEKWQIKLAAQDISRFEQGAYTGEIAASQITNLCQYAIIGHWERRHYFAETEEILFQKVQNVLQSGITPIFCIQGEETPIPQGVTIVAYEPILAIGSGVPETPENAFKLAQAVKQKADLVVIYGGSVTGENTGTFIKRGIIDGVLVGMNSLNPQSFISIIEAAHY